MVSGVGWNVRRGRKNGVKMHDLGEGWSYKQMEMGWDPGKDGEKIQLERSTRKLPHSSSQSKN